MTFYNAIVLKKEDIVKDSQLRKTEYIHVVRILPKVYSSRLWKKTGLKIVIEGGKR